MTLATCFRHTLHRLARRPGFAAAAILILALGIGATTALFSVTSAALLRPLPWPSADRLVHIHAVLPERRQAPANLKTWNRAPISWSAWHDLQASQAFEEVGVWYLTQHVLHGPNGGMVQIMYASASLLSMLGAQPSAGRLFSSEEDQGMSAHLLLTHASWQRYFGGRSDVLDQTVALAATPESPGVMYSIVGVLPEGFTFPGESPEFVLAVGRMAWNGSFETNRFLRAIGRLPPGVSADAALAVAEPLVRREERPEQRTARIVTIADEQFGDLSGQLWLLSGGAILLLLVAASNVGGLLLCEARARRHEIAVRTALGASRGQVLQELAVEHLLIGVSAGVAGLVLAQWLTPLLVSLAPPGLSTLDTASLDPGVIGLALALGLATTILFGLTPAILLSSTAPTEALSQGGRQSTRAGLRGHRLVVSTALALAVVLVVGAGLFGETLRRLSSVPLGFTPSDLTVVTIQMTRYPTVSALTNPPAGASIEEIRDEYVRLQRAGWLHTAGIVDRLAALPGVTGVAGVATAPFTGTANQMRIRPLGAPAVDEQIVQRQHVTEGYFDVMGVSVLEGRALTASDRQRNVALVSRELGRRLFHGRGEGQRFVAGTTVYEVVGVVENVKHHELGQDDAATAYLLNRTVRDVNQFVVRSSNSSSRLPPLLKPAIEGHDPHARVAATVAMTDLVAGSVAEERFRGWISAMFAAAALLLAAVGLYGLSARYVAERHREIGVRMTLGASPRDIAVLVLRDAGMIIVLGIGLGLPGAYALGMVARSFLYGVSATAPAVFLLAAGVLATVAILSALLPARRAARVDPVVALRD